MHFDLDAQIGAAMSSLPKGDDDDEDDEDDDQDLEFDLDAQIGAAMGSLPTAEDGPDASKGSPTHSSAEPPPLSSAITAEDLQNMLRNAMQQAAREVEFEQMEEAYPTTSRVTLEDLAEQQARQEKIDSLVLELGLDPTLDLNLDLDYDDAYDEAYHDDNAYFDEGLYQTEEQRFNLTDKPRIRRSLLDNGDPNNVFNRIRTQNSHAIPNYYGCDFRGCDRVVSRAPWLRWLPETRSSAKDFPCRQFAKKENLQTHRKRHTGKKPFKCEMCPVEFDDSQDYAYHYRTHDTTRRWRYRCKGCHNLFAERSMWEKHLRQEQTENTQGRCSRIGECEIEMRRRARLAIPGMRRKSQKGTRADADTEGVLPAHEGMAAHGTNGGNAMQASASGTAHQSTSLPTSGAAQPNGPTSSAQVGQRTNARPGSAAAPANAKSTAQGSGGIETRQQYFSKTNFDESALLASVLVNQLSSMLAQQYDREKSLLLMEESMAGSSGTAPRANGRHLGAGASASHGRNKESAQMGNKIDINTALLKTFHNAGLTPREMSAVSTALATVASARNENLLLSLEKGKRIKVDTVKRQNQLIVKQQQEYARQEMLRAQQEAAKKKKEEDAKKRKQAQAAAARARAAAAKAKAAEAAKAAAAKAQADALALPDDPEAPPPMALGMLLASAFGGSPRPTPPSTPTATASTSTSQPPGTTDPTKKANRSSTAVAASNPSAAASPSQSRPGSVGPSAPATPAARSPPPSPQQKHATPSIEVIPVQTPAEIAAAKAAEAAIAEIERHRLEIEQRQRREKKRAEAAFNSTDIAVPAAPPPAPTLHLDDEIDMASLLASPPKPDYTKLN